MKAGKRGMKKGRIQGWGKMKRLQGEQTWWVGVGCGMKTKWGLIKPGEGKPVTRGEEGRNVTSKFCLVCCNF